MLHRLLVLISFVPRRPLHYWNMWLHLSYCPFEISIQSCCWAYYNSFILQTVKLTPRANILFIYFPWGLMLSIYVQVLLPFSRDTHLLELTKTSISTPAKSFIRGKLGMPEYSVIYPPSGIIPFYGFSMLGKPWKWNSAVVRYILCILVIQTYSDASIYLENGSI